ncbi:putative ATP-dependent RNA helicase DDX52 [Glandiceps talaboti]
MATSSSDLFMKLGIGVKFDTRRFQKDAERFGLKSKVETPATLQENRQNLDSSNQLSNEDIEIPNKKKTGKRKRGKDNGDEQKSEKKKKGKMDVFNESSLSTSVTADVKVSRRLDAAKEQQIHIEKIREIRRKQKIHVIGTDIPEPVTSFEQLQEKYKLHPVIMKNIHSVGYYSPTAVQMQAVPLLLNKREVLVCAPTGSGKTAAFIIPILNQLKGPRKKGIFAVVVSPTRELAQQTHREFCRLAEGLGLRIHIIDKVSKAIKKLNSQSPLKIDILVTTPNKLVYMLKQDPPAIKLNNVHWLVVDESDKLFEEGKQGFREQLATIYQACDSSQVRRALFSATFAYDVEQWCRLNLDNVASVNIGQRNSAVDTVEQEILYVGQEFGKLLAVRDIIAKGVQPPVLVFVQSKDRAKELFNELLYDGINVDVIHADRTQLQRDNLIDCFRAGKIWLLICTELMGRGIDFKGVNLVINYDFPTSAISYIHRIGRTGRAGRPGKAITFFTRDDLANLRSIASVMRGAGCPVPEYMLQLQKPNRKTRKMLESKEVKRSRIRTTPRDILEKYKKKKKFIKKALEEKSTQESRSRKDKKKRKRKTKMIED